MNRGRIITWSLMLGAIFPDTDVVPRLASPAIRLLIITWHRSITHSLLLLPLLALLLAAHTRGFANWRKWEAPSFATLTVIYAVGILSHILLDLVTSFGTMIWSPLNGRVPRGISFSLWISRSPRFFSCRSYSRGSIAHPEKVKRRADRDDGWYSCRRSIVSSPQLAEIVGAPISDVASSLIAMLIVSALFLLPSASRAGA